jgi:hypothetical protein
MSYYLLTTMMVISFYANAQVKSGQPGSTKSPIDMSIKEKGSKTNTSVGSQTTTVNNRTEPTTVTSNTSANNNTNNSTIAKFVFEEAEAAYASGEYLAALSKLNETEKLLGTSNPKIFHLKILTEHRLFEADPAVSFEKLEALRKSCDLYLKNTNGVSEDKLRDIYKVSVRLKEYPLTRQSFEEQAAKAKAASERKMFEDFNYFKEYELGITVSEAKSRYPGFFKNTTNVPSEYGESLMSFSIEGFADFSKELIMGLYIKNNKLIGYYGRIHFGADDSQHSKSREKINALIQILNASCNCTYAETKTKGKINKTDVETISKIWEQDKKIIRIDQQIGSIKGEYFSYVFLYIIDPKLAL